MEIESGKAEQIKTGDRKKSKIISDIDITIITCYFLLQLLRTQPITVDVNEKSLTFNIDI